MLETYQKTIAKEVSFSGISLHKGRESKVRILPGESDLGIIFKRTDLKNNNVIKAKYDNVSSAKLCTTIRNNKGIEVSTIEHLLAALYIAEVDNAIIEINCDEVPIMDGSAKNFLEKLKSVGTKDLDKKRKYLKILSTLRINDGEKEITIEPNNDTLKVDFELKYDNKLIGNQKNVVDFNCNDLNDISESRTFCLSKDIEKIKNNGLAKGGSLYNAVVVDEEKILNKSGLRNKNEFVNHKILDLVGDFYLAGCRIIGSVKCKQGGHQLTNTFLRHILSSKNNFKSISSEESHIRLKVDPTQTSKIAINA